MMRRMTVTVINGLADVKAFQLIEHMAFFKWARHMYIKRLSGSGQAEIR